MSKIEQATTQELARIEKRSDGIVEYARYFEILSDDEYRVAEEKMKEWKAIINAVKSHYKKVCDLTHKAWKASTEARAEHLTPPDRASKILIGKMANYRMEREKQEQEHKEAAQKAAEAVHKEAIEAQAKELEDAGDSVTAEAVREMSDDVPVVVQKDTSLKARGNLSVDWEIVSTDSTQVPPEYLLVDVAAILKVIRGSKGNVQIPGVKFIEVPKLRR